MGHTADRTADRIESVVFRRICKFDAFTKLVILGVFAKARACTPN